MAEGYVDEFAPSWIVLESSDMILEGQRVDSAVLTTSLAARGYATHGVIVDASEYGLPQGRRRAYITSILRCGTADLEAIPPDEVFTHLDNHMNRCRRAPPSLETVLFNW